MKKDDFIRHLKSTTTVGIGGEFGSDVKGVFDVQCDSEKRFEFNNYATIDFTHCHFTSLTISGNCKLYFKHCQIETLIIKGGEVKFLNLHGCNKLINSSTRTVSISASANENMVITLHDNAHTKSVKFNLFGCLFDKLVLNLNQERCKVKILDSTCNYLTFSNFKIHENSHVLISNTEVKKFLRFSNSDLSDIEFIGCSFISAIHLIDNSSFKNAKFFTINWFKTIYLTSDIDKRKDDNFGDYTGNSEFSEGYREYKTIMQGLKNRTDEIYFKAKEYNSKLSQLKWKWATLSDRIVLTLNKYSNNHGQFWFIPVGWLIAFSAIFYFLFVWSLTGTNGFSDSLELFWLHRVNIFLFINPTHKIDSILVAGSGLTGNAKFIDFGFRVISAYLLFQTVSAFRKYKE